MMCVSNCARGEYIRRRRGISTTPLKLLMRVTCDMKDGVLAIEIDGCEITAPWWDMLAGKTKRLAAGQDADHPAC